jgi:xylulokinase
LYSVGIELSTQSVKLVVLDLKDTRMVYSGAFDYDRCFPQYDTRGGVLPSNHPDIRHTSPLMLIEALDYVFKVLPKGIVDPVLIRIIKVDAMQHCTVYTNNEFKRRIQKLRIENLLAEQLGPCLTRPTSPIWEDRSPVAETIFLTEQLKALGGIIKLTGNRAELRFPAAQILKWARESPEAYLETTHIFLLSAFITSILTGIISPVDTGDGWGSNLNNLDIHHPGWSREVLSVAEEYLGGQGPRNTLSEKIGLMDHYDSYAGTLNLYFVKKYGLHPETVVLVGTGDNPATLLGCGGGMVISLGSSYTVCGAMNDIVPSAKGEYNIFGYTPGSAMALSVISNGGKVHEDFMRRYLFPQGEEQPKKLDWETYTEMAGDLELTGDENLMLPYLSDESVPLRKRGIIRNGFSEEEAAANIRALHLSQVISLRVNSGHLGEVKELCIVAGGAKNRLFRQWIADAFNASTYSIRNADVAAPFGCALSGAAKVLGLTYQEAAGRFVQKDEGSLCRPVPGNVKVMKHLIRKYQELEEYNERA